MSDWTGDAQEEWIGRDPERLPRYDEMVTDEEWKRAATWLGERRVGKGSKTTRCIRSGIDGWQVVVRAQDYKLDSFIFRERDGDLRQVVEAMRRRRRL